RRRRANLCLKERRGRASPSDRQKLRATFVPERAQRSGYVRRRSRCARPILENERAIQSLQDREESHLHRRKYSRPESRRLPWPHCFFDAVHAEQLATDYKRHSQIAMDRGIRRVVAE